MSNGESISIVLSPAQVDQVVRAAAEGSTPSFSALISTTLDARRLAARGNQGPTSGPGGDPDTGTDAGPDGQNATRGYFPTYDDTRLSRSLLRGLSILTCFGPDNEERGIIELANQLGMSPSTTHRYVATLVELGLLERCTRSRKYRLPKVSNGGTAANGATAPVPETGAAG